MAVNKLGRMPVVLAGRVKGVGEGVTDTLEEEYPLISVEPQHLMCRRDDVAFKTEAHSGNWSPGLLPTL